MKLALVSHLFPSNHFPYHGKFIKDQLLLLDQSNEISVRLVVPTPYTIPFTSRHKRNTSVLLSSNITAERVSYLSIPQKKLPRLIQQSLSKSLLNYFSQLPYDLIHLHWLYPDGMAIPALKKQGFNCVLTIHGSDWYNNINRTDLFPIIKEIFKNVDHVLFVGHKLQEDVLSIFPFVKTKCSIIYNLVDQEFYTHPSSHQKEEALQKLGWDQNKKHFLTVASSAPKKGVDLLIKAVLGLIEQYSDIKFHIVGTSQDDFPHSSSVSFHPFVTPKDLLTYYHASNAYISPSRSEGFGLAMIEAATTGLPIAATPTGIAPYFINNQTGVLSSGFSSSNIQTAITELVKNQGSYNPEIIRKQSLDLFGKEKFQERLLKTYHLLLG